MFNPFRKPIAEVDAADLTRVLPHLAEGFPVEYKGPEKVHDNEEIAKTIASFANTHGGWLFIGVRADPETNKPKPEGIVGVESQCGLSQRIYQSASDRLSPWPYFVCHEVKVPEDRVVLAADVMESPSPPHIYMQDGRIYVRRGDTKKPLDHVRDRAELNQLYAKADRNREEVQALLGHHKRGEDLFEWVKERTGEVPPRAAWWVCLMYPASRIDGLLPYAVDPEFPNCDWPGRGTLLFGGCGGPLVHSPTQFGACVRPVESMRQEEGYYLDTFGHIAMGGLIEHAVRTAPSDKMRTLAEEVSEIYQKAGYWGQVEIEVGFRELSVTKPRSCWVRRTSSVRGLPPLDVGSIRAEIGRALGSRRRD